MLSAMNAVVIWTIEQSITGSNGVKTGEESSKSTNSDLAIKEEPVLLAYNDDGTVTDAGGGILLPIVGPNRPDDTFNPNNMKDNAKAITKFQRRLFRLKIIDNAEKFLSEVAIKSIVFKLIRVQSVFGMLAFPEPLNEGEEQWLTSNYRK